jgi:hypothetical protein
MNERIASLASKVAVELIKNGLFDEEQHELAVKLIGDAIYADIYPEKCVNCGSILCPNCGGHTEPGFQPGEVSVENPPSENELLPLCPYCAVYVKADRTTEPIVFENDRRFIHDDSAVQMFDPEKNAAGDDEEPPLNGDFRDGWKN